MADNWQHPVFPGIENDWTRGIESESDLVVIGEHNLLAIVLRMFYERRRPSTNKVFALICNKLQGVRATSNLVSGLERCWKTPFEEGDSTDRAMRELIAEHAASLHRRPPYLPTLRRDDRFQVPHFQLGDEVLVYMGEYTTDPEFAKKRGRCTYLRSEPFVKGRIVVETATELTIGSFGAETFVDTRTQQFCETTRPVNRDNTEYLKPAELEWFRTAPIVPATRFAAIWYANGLPDMKRYSPERFIDDILHGEIVPAAP